MLRPITEDDLPVILHWRNHPDVRRVMFTDHEITPAEHRAWWKRVKADPKMQLYLFSHNGEPAGMVQYFDIDNGSRTCHWGYYLDNYQQRDMTSRLQCWLALEQEAVAKAFDDIGCGRLICETFEFNREVLQIHRKFGFSEVETILREKAGQQERVVVMALDRTKRHPDTHSLSKPAQSLSIAFLGSANWDLIARNFTEQYEMYTGAPVELFFMPFGQHAVQLADPDSPLRRSQLDFYVFCERLEDLLDSPFAIFDTTQQTVLEERFDRYLQMLERTRAALPGRFLVLDLSPVRPVSTTLEDSVYDDASPSGIVTRLNTRLQDLCNSLPDCHLVRISNLVAQFGARNANPGKFWHLGRFAYASEFGKHLNRRLIQTILALTGRTARLVVLDLDNTLWGGVVGDDGLKGIHLGGDFPGSSYVEIQRVFKALKERGVALAVCSKNTEAVALEAIAAHPHMVLQPEDFVTMRVNWSSKPDNLRKIADEAGLGLSSICLIDDSPYEREEVRRALPDVLVPEMPVDKTEWADFLFNLPYLASTRLTQEDRERARRYLARSQLKKSESCFADKESFWRSLGMRLHFQRLTDGNLQRVLQLLAKTNQFNMTTRRHTESDLSRLATQGAHVIAVGLSDRYSELEIIGVLVITYPPARHDTAVIDTFLLSCRVLGRSVETGILGWLCQLLKGRGIQRLVGLFQVTERNAPAAQVYVEHGFREVLTGEYVLDLERQALTVPDWFESVGDFAP